MIVGRSYRQDHQRAKFVAPSHDFQGNAVTQTVEFTHIRNNLVVAEVLLTNLKTKKGFGRWNDFIVSRAFR